MAASTTKELETQIAEVGKKLLKPPSTVEGLLNLLDKIDSCLSRVEQSPSVSMQNALCDSMKALVADKLLRHSDIDVKVAVASCVSEITRITAPEAPYNDDQMKEIFQLIVVSFEKLFDTSSRSYDKRVSILETVAKVRSCVVMLDLECDALILEMFQYFLKSIRAYHPENVFSSMEIIMTLVLDESEEIPAELLYPLLTAVKTDNQDVLPIAKRLAEKVLENSVDKLKPYLPKAMESIGTSLRDYSEVVASICPETSDKVQPNDQDQQKMPEKADTDETSQQDQQKMPEKVDTDDTAQEDTKEVPERADFDEATVSDDAPPVADELNPEMDSVPEKSQKATTNDVNAQTGACSGSTEKKEFSDSVTKDKADKNSVTVDPEIKEAGEIGTKSGEQKSTPSVRSAEVSENSRIGTDEEAGERAEEKKGQDEEPNNSPSHDLAADEAAVPSENGKRTQTQLSSPAESHSETVKAAPSSLSKKKSQPPKKKRKSSKGSTSSVKKGALSDHQAQTEDEQPPSDDAIPKTEIEKEKNPEENIHEHSGKKVKADKDKVLHADDISMRGSEEKQQADTSRRAKANEDEAPEPVDDISMKESDPASETEVEPLRRSGKKEGDNSLKDDKLPLDKEVKTKKGRGKNKSEKDLTGEPSSKEKVAAAKTTKSSNKEQSHSEETPSTKPKRKRTPVKEVAPITPNSSEGPGEDLVGAKIEVWWPHDKKFYEGTVGSFDSVKKKHTVLYVDGEIEFLNLQRQRWQRVEDNTSEKQEEATELSDPDSSELPQEKKARTDLVSSTPKTKRNSSVKRRKRSSTSKSRTKSDSRSKITAESIDKSDDENSDKSIDELIKSTGKRKKGVQTPINKANDDETSSEPEEKDDKSKAGKDNNSKAENDDNSEDEAPKSSSKLKDFAEKRSGKAMVKGGVNKKTSTTKAKGEETPNSNKSPVNTESSGAKKGKSGSSSKVHESRGSSSRGKPVKAEESETKKTEKAKEGETISGRKRPRKARR